MKTTKPLAILLAAFVAVSSAQAGTIDTFGGGPNTFDIEFVGIGNPGNPADTTGSPIPPHPTGSVPYSYRIGKYEVSRDMVLKANAEGGLGITLNAMGSVTGGPRPDMPATGISWNEAARFVNWLNTSKGHAPAYKFALQPGDVGYNANANILLWDVSDPGYNPNNLYRNRQARYFLPSVDEWYKAAYYDPVAEVYYNYPTGSNSAPTAVTSGTAAGTAVWGQPFAQGPADITLAGGLSPYGTMGQGGNVYEWEETSSNLLNNSVSSGRGFRGGGWSFVSSYLLATVHINGSSTDEDDDIGFRVASVPEPGTLLLAATAGLGLLLRRRR